MFILCEVTLTDVDSAILLFHSNLHIYERSSRPLDTFESNPNVNDWLAGSPSSNLLTQFAILDW